VPLFDVGSPAYQGPNTIGGTAALIWSGTYSPLGSVSPAVTCRDISIINTGTATCYVGGSSVTTAALPLGPGQQVTVQGWTATSDKTTSDIYGITTGGGTQTTTVAGLATVASVV
jgi:hypothetical protein